MPAMPVRHGQQRRPRRHAAMASSAAACVVEQRGRVAGVRVLVIIVILAFCVSVDDIRRPFHLEADAWAVAAQQAAINIIKRLPGA
jgi:hypothetical protein